MAVVNFSVPDEVKTTFSAAFKGENRSAIIARASREAVKAKRREVGRP